MNSKTSFKELAILGGLPVFVEPIHVGRPNIGDREQFLRRANEMLDRNWLTNRGPFVQEFEQRIADMMGVSHCIAMCNATVALEIAIRALGCQVRSSSRPLRLLLLPTPFSGRRSLRSFVTLTQ
jgi:hypothetical protein